MSRWTHIRGVIEVTSEPFELKPMKLVQPKEERNKSNDDEWAAYWEERKRKSYYPFPKEQFILSTPVLQETWDKKYYTRIQAYEYSLPRARRYLEEAFNLLPQGEVGWHPAIKQDKTNCGSSSSFADYSCQQKAFQQGVLELYKDEYWYFTFKELEKHLKIQLTWIEHIDGIIMGIREDLRYCSGLELMEGLEKFFLYLKDHDIDLEDGYLEWQDEYDPDHIFAWRCSRIDYDCEHQFMILDSKTNAILYAKKYDYKRTEDGEIDWFAKGWNIIETGDLSLVKKGGEENE